MANWGRPQPVDRVKPDCFEARPLRIAIIYDCLYPHTIGGAERWYHALATRLAARHRVTYLTRTQWETAPSRDAPRDVKVIGLGRRRGLYTASGRRRILPPLLFGCSVLIHLLKNRRNYDVVHTCSFPYFPMFFAAAARAVGGPPIVTDWIEVWPSDYWRKYLGCVRGAIGVVMQKLCIRLTSSAFTFSDLIAEQLREHGYQGKPVVIRGIYDGPVDLPAPDRRRPPVIVYVGRHIFEKHVASIPAAIALARKEIPDLRGIIFGDGPERRQVLDEIDRLRLRDAIRCPGFAPWEQIDCALRNAMCLVLPSEREGYGLVVVEAAARGTPSLLVKAQNNAATALIKAGINGYIAESAEPSALTAGILKVHAAGPALVSRTSAWFREHEKELRIEGSLERIEQVYRTIVGELGSRLKSL
jgi:glycosyltransferase involved in cell wall biosynthesis